MGTTAEKGAYIIETKSLLKDKINNLGGDITVETTFREYANQLQNVYDNLPKTEYQEGTEINLGKTSKGKLDFAKEYQEVEYIESTGTQYIDTGKKATSNNIKIKTKVFTPSFPTNTEEDIIANFGTDNSRFVVGLFSGNVFQYNNGNPNASVTGFSGEQTLEIEANYDFTSSNKTIKVGNSIVTGTYTIGVSNNTDNIIIFANAQHSRNFTGKLYYIQYYENGTLVFDFIPCYRISDNVIGLYDKVEGKFYTNAGTGTFTKGADVGSGFNEIVGIGQSSQDSTQGYQLFNPTLQTSTINGVTCTRNSDNTFTLNGTATAQTLFNIEAMNLDTSQTYTLTGCPTGGSGSTYFIGGANFGDYGSGATAIPSRANITFAIVIQNGYTANNLLFKPMLEKGSTAHDWEKYTGGQASPNPDYKQDIHVVTGTQDVAVSGINEINIEYPTTTAYGVTCTKNGDGTYTFNGTAERDLYFDMCYFYLPKGTHKLVGCPTGGSWATYVLYVRRQDGQPFTINDLGSGGSTEVVGDEGQLRLSVFVKSGYNCNNLSFKPMITTNTSLTYNDYEPYITPKTYQFSLGDHKFYGIGTYRDYIWADRSTGKWYKHSEIGEKIFTGASSENWMYWQGLILIDDTTIRSLGTSNTNFYLNYFRNVLSIAYIGSNTGQRLHINLSNSGLSEITTPTAWKTWLSTHNLEFVYVCNETDTEITGTLAEQLEAWYNAHSNNGTTIITSNGDLPMIIKVRGLKGE